MARLAFALDCAAKIVGAQDGNCPYCGSARTRLIQRKNILLHLRKCDDCALMFRWPKPTAAASAAFYEHGYREGNVTDLPSPETAARFARDGFVGSELDCTPHVNVMLGVCPNRGRLLDYGASWGYGVHQLRAVGFDAVGFELSKRRAKFARDQIGVEVVDDARSLAPHSIDVIHTSHVLEHIVDLRAAFSDFRRLLKPGGHVVIFVPNGNGRSARLFGAKWGQMINEVHVTALTAEFLTRALAEFGFVSTCRDESEDELCVVAHLNV